MDTERTSGSIFISYRHADFRWALAVYQSLTQYGYDVFIDYPGIDTSNFKDVILENIAARAHFLVIFTPSALKHCGEPGGLMGLEIEAAIDNRRNIVSLLLEGASLDSAMHEHHLTNTLMPITRYSSIIVPNDYFQEAMGRLREKFLDVPLSTVIRTPSLSAQRATIQQQAAARATNLHFYSCFISFSTKDQAFAERLYVDLTKNGVDCWFSPHDMRGGEGIHEQIDDAILIHDRLLVILSEHSIRSHWVKTEITKARKRGVRENRRVLFPLGLIDFETLLQWEWLDSDTGADLASEIRAYFIPDFTDWNEPEPYHDALNRLLRDLVQTGQPLIDSVAQTGTKG